MTDLKVGDIVEVIHDHAYDAGIIDKQTSANYTDLKKGYRGVVTKVIPDQSTVLSGCWWIYVDGKGGIIDKLLKKIEKQEFKVGQRVLVHSGANLSKFNGKEGIIKSIDLYSSNQPNIYVEFDNKLNNCCYCYPFKSKVEERIFNVEIIDNNKTKTMQTKTYPDKFYVEGGSKSLREAFIKDLQQAKLSPSGTFTESMFIKDSNNLSLQGNKYWSTTTMPGHKYTLPADYNEALEAFKELLKEPAKPQSIDVKVNYKDGQLNIKIQKNIIETIDGTFIGALAKKYIEDLQNIINSSEKIQSDALGKWDIIIEKITVGCKIDCNISDLKKILIKWKELN